MDQYVQQDFTSWSLQQIRDLQRNMISSKDITQFLCPLKAQNLNNQINNFLELLITAVLANPNLIQSLDNKMFLQEYILTIIQQTNTSFLSGSFTIKDPINKSIVNNMKHELIYQIKKDNLQYIQQEYRNDRNRRMIFVQDAYFPAGINITILEASAYFGAINIFKNFYKIKRIKIYRTFYFTILGNQIDIAKYLILENADNINFFVHLIGCAVKNHHASFIQMIQENIKEDQKLNVNRIIFRKAILYMNFDYINEQYCEGIFVKDNKSYIKNAEILILLEKQKGVKWDLLKRYFYPIIQHYQSIFEKFKVNGQLELLKDIKPMSNLSLIEYIKFYPMNNFEEFFQRAALAKDFKELYRLAKYFGNHSFFVQELKNADPPFWNSNFVYETPLSCLMKSDTKECYNLFKKLIKNPRINPNTSFQTLKRDGYGQYNTLLTYCIRNNKYDYLSLLMKNPLINVNCPEVLIGMAWMNGSYEITKKTPLAIAIESGNQQMIEYLVNSCGIKLNKNIYAERYYNQEYGDYHEFSYNDYAQQYVKDVNTLEYVKGLLSQGYGYI